MVFPQTILPIRVELDLGDWTDITTYVRREPNLIAISHGRSNEVTRLTASTASLTVQNWDGRFSERNPTGPYFGLLGRNTPIRISEVRTTNVAELFGSTSDTITCPDAAGLDITSDIDIRLDLAPASWRPSAILDLAGRYSISGNNRAWAVELNPSGTLRFYWSPDGTLAARLSVVSTVSIPEVTDRLAIRVTLDVNNGAGGSTATFYTSPTIGGTWTQLGAQVVTAGVTSIANVTAGIELGDVAALSGSPVVADVYGFEMRDGIGGTAKANPDFTSEGAGSIDTTDAAGNLWFLNGPDSFVTDRWTYFCGEVTEWPQDWDISRLDATVQVEASGILRRLGQGRSVFKSTLYRALSAPGSAAPPVAYWPCEDAEGSTQIASTSPLVPAMTFTVAPTFADYDGFAASLPLPTTQNSNWYGAVPAYSASNTQQARFMFHIDAGVNGERIFTVYLSGTVRSIRLHYATGGSLNLLAYDATETVLASTGATAFAIDGKKIRLSIEITQNGANVDFGVVRLEVGASTGGVASATAAGQTAGRITGVSTNAGGGLAIGTNLATFGHISVHNTITSIYDLADEITAYNGETAGTRFARLCGEQNVPFQSIGDLTLSEQMGPQLPGTFLTLLYECADLDGGLMFEPRNVLGLGYRTRISLENQPVKLPIDHAAHELAAPLKPVPDDSGIRNQATITRKGGSAATAELTSGRLSTEDPPSGVGLYDTALTVNAYSDSRLADLANYTVYMGTVDEERYPGISVDMASRELVANPVLTARFRRTDVGDRLAISNPPVPQLPPDTIGQLVQGYRLTIAQFEKRYVLNCSPATPWDLAILEETAADRRLDTDGATLLYGVSATEVELQVASSPGPVWVNGSTDLTSNPDFETNLTGWSGTGGVATRVNTQSKKGSWSAKFVPDGVTVYPGLGSSQVAASAGVSYRASAWIRCEVARTISLNINWFTGGGAYISTGTVSVVCPANTWVFGSGSLTAPGTTGLMNLNATIDNTPPASHVIYVDYARICTTTTSAELPFDIKVSGEVMTVTDISNSSGTQVFRVTRSVNSVSKAQVAGADIRVRYPLVLSL